MAKLLLGYVHLLATCLALGSILVADWRLYRGRYYPLRRGALARLDTTKNVALGSLLVLWITGPLLLLQAYLAAPETFAMTGKLWAKLTVVLVLTINGGLLHVVALPRLAESGALMERRFAERFAFAILGAVSLVSWLFAAFLGIARSWNGGVSYEAIMAIYGSLLTLALAGGALMFVDRSGPERPALARRA